jgi:hypothetical protein
MEIREVQVVVVVMHKGYLVVMDLEVVEQLVKGLMELALILAAPSGLQREEVEREELEYLIHQIQLVALVVLD